jgi:hypothetical protein
VKAAKVLRAERFELVDADGKVRATLGLHADGGTGLALTGKDGIPHLGLSVDGNGVSDIILWDSDGRPCASIAQAPRVGPSLASDSEGASAELKVHGIPVLRLAHSTRSRWQPVGSSVTVTSSSLDVCDREGKLLWVAPPIKEEDEARGASDEDSGRAGEAPQAAPPR